jgi:tryptophan-rich sensory protein
MDESVQKTAPASTTAAAAIASCALTVPLALSLSSTPSPNHPRTLLWYRSLHEPKFKPPDGLFPLAWGGIEAAWRWRAIDCCEQHRALHDRSRWCYFKRHDLATSTVAAVGLLATSVAFVSEARPVDKVASRAGLPLAGWVACRTW